MGRISNVVSLLNVRRPLKNQSFSLWWNKNSFQASQDIFLYINSFFLQRNIRALGLILFDIELKQMKNVLEVTLYLYHPNSDILLGVVSENEDIEKLNTKFVLSQQYFYTKLLILEKLLLVGFSCFFFQNIVLNLKLGSNANLSARLVVTYIITKLRQNFSLGEIIVPLVRSLNKWSILNGFRINCSGRFTRKQRASKMVLKGGSIPFSSRSILLDYAEGSSNLKFGKCGIKVWLFNKDASKKYLVSFTNAK